MIPSSNLISPFSTVKAFRTSTGWRFKLTRSLDGRVFRQGDTDVFVEISLAINFGTPTSPSFIVGFPQSYTGSTDTFTSSFSFDVNTDEWLYSDGNINPIFHSNVSGIIRVISDAKLPSGETLRVTGNFPKAVQVRQRNVLGDNSLPYYVRKTPAIVSGSLQSYFIDTTPATETWQTEQDVLLTMGRYEVEIPTFLMRLPIVESVPPDSFIDSEITSMVKKIAVLSSLPYKITATTGFTVIKDNPVLNTRQVITFKGQNLSSGTFHNLGEGSPISTNETHLAVTTNTIEPISDFSDFDSLISENVSGLPTSGETFLRMFTGDFTDPSLYRVSWNLISLGGDASGPQGSREDFFTATGYPAQL